jgi:hypothetical protein
MRIDGLRAPCASGSAFQQPTASASAPPRVGPCFLQLSARRRRRIASVVTSQGPPLAFTIQANPGFGEDSHIVLMLSHSLGVRRAMSGVLCEGCGHNSPVTTPPAPTMIHLRPKQEPTGPNSADGRPASSAAGNGAFLAALSASQCSLRSVFLLAPARFTGTRGEISHDHERLAPGSGMYEPQQV